MNASLWPPSMIHRRITGIAAHSVTTIVTSTRHHNHQVRLYTGMAPLDPRLNGYAAAKLKPPHSTRKLHDFLVEHAKFPFPPTVESRSLTSTAVSVFDTGLLKREWKAGYAVRDNELAEKLCQNLEHILGDTPLTLGDEKSLLDCFSPKLQEGCRASKWELNDNEWIVGSSPYFKASASGRLTVQIEPVVTRSGILPSSDPLLMDIRSIFPQNGD
jgi:hypothetical protein